MTYILSEEDRRKLEEALKGPSAQCDLPAVSVADVAPSGLERK